MVQGTAHLVVDLGNSSTKGMVMFGRDAQTGKYRERKFELSNVFAPIDEGYAVSSDYNEMTSTIIRVDTELNGRVIKGDFCNGELQQKEKPMTTIKPTASVKKYDLDSTVLSYRLAFLFAYKAIMNMTRTSDFNQLDVEWCVTTLLPPGDMETGKNKITDIIKNITEVNAVFPNVRIPVKVSKVAVFPEGFSAFCGVVFDKGQIYRPDYKFLTEETVLVFDVGAGTTDCLIVKNNTLVQSSKFSIQQGGNNVFQIVKRMLRFEGLEIDDDSLRRGMITGEVKDGAKLVNIVDYINRAKAEIAQKIISSFQDFLEVTDLKARSVGHVIVCGGGSMSGSEVMGIEPLSKKIVDFFKELSPNSEMVALPTHIVTKTLEDGTPAKVTETISPRELNLIGASYLAEAVWG